MEDACTRANQQPVWAHVGTARTQRAGPAGAGKRGPSAPSAVSAMKITCRVCSCVSEPDAHFQPTSLMSSSQDTPDSPCHGKTGCRQLSSIHSASAPTHNYPSHFIGSHAVSDT